MCYILQKCYQPYTLTIPPCASESPRLFLVSLAGRLFWLDKLSVIFPPKLYPKKPVAPVMKIVLSRYHSDTSLPGTFSLVGICQWNNIHIIFIPDIICILIYLSFTWNRSLSYAQILVSVIEIIRPIDRNIHNDRHSNALLVHQTDTSLRNLEPTNSLTKHSECVRKECT